MGDGKGSGKTAVATVDAGSVWIRGWFPVLFELSCIINRSNLVRKDFKVEELPLKIFFSLF